MTRAIYSTMIRSDTKTYFVDVREAKNGNRFLALTERSTDRHQGRGTIRVFSSEATEHLIAAFREALILMKGEELP